MNSAGFDPLGWRSKSVSNRFRDNLTCMNFIVIMWIFKCSCAEERKVAIRKVPEQAILGEVRRMVEEMQTLNKKLEETESAIEEYFKPIDKEAETLMKVQLEGEERSMKNMVKVMQQQALFEKAEAGKFTNTLQTDKNQHNHQLY
ncbi:hypothetical protein SDJN03_28514, partial [Cucurbita argyrosperma subsp. sororia]